MIISKNQSIARNYVRVHTDDRTSYGGNQGWFSKTEDKRAKLLAKGGCGLVACADLILYHAAREKLNWEDLPASFLADDAHRVDREEYKQFLRRLNRISYPILPFFGSFNWQVPICLNLFFRRHHADVRIRMLLRNDRKTRKAVISESLENGYPCILLIGPHFPGFRKKPGVTFYTMPAEGQMVPTCSDVLAHFVTVTGLYFPDDASAPMYLEISSWGNKYYIDSEELDRYIRKYSNPLFSSLFYVKKPERA